MFLTGGSVPFISTYDPQNWGRPYCAEVSVGCAISSPQSMSRSLEVIPGMEGTFLFGGGERFPASGSLSLMSDGGFKVRLCSASSNSDVSIVHETVFRCASVENV